MGTTTAPESTALAATRQRTPKKGVIWMDDEKSTTKRKT